MKGAAKLQPLSYLTAALDSGEWSDLHSGRFTPEEKTHRTFKMDVRWAEQPVREFWIREQFLTLGVQHVAQSIHRHTEYGIAVCRLSTLAQRNILY